MSENRAEASSRLLEELIVRYWDNALRPDELRALNRTLGSSEEARAQFLQFCVQTLSIGEQFAVEKVYPLPTGACRTAPADARRPVWRAVTVVAALVVTVGLAALVSWKAVQTPVSPQHQGVEIAWVDDFSGRVRVFDGNGKGVSARVEQPLLSGQTVSVSDVDGTAEIRFHDGTQLVLNGKSEVQVFGDGQKKVRVSHGNLAADVRPQPAGQPMILVTAETEVQVLGTKLSLSESKRKTEVAVVQGEVRLTQLSDRQSVAINSGEVVTAIKGNKDLVLRKLAELPDTYTLDFERIPSDWGSGELIEENLPEGSRIGMQTAPASGDPSGGLHYQIRSHNAWTRGLFAMHEDSWLHLRFRQEKRGFFHVLLVARGVDPIKRAVVFETPQFWQRRKAGEWHQVSIPLGKSKRLGKSPLDLLLPLVVYKVIISSQGVDRGLAIDRLWVTRVPPPK